VPPFSGFYSKDAILATALEANPILFGVAILVAALTTFYMSRLVLVAFLGSSKSEAADHAHESPRSMTIPLMLLAVPSVAAGWIPVGDFVAAHFGVHGHGGGAVEPEVGFGAMLTLMLKGIDHALFSPFNHNALAAMLGLFGVLLGGSVAWGLYANQTKDPLPGMLGRFARAMRKKFYFDEIYEGIFIPLHDAVARVFAWVDRWIVDGLGVRGVHGSAEIVGRALRLVQTGNLQTYAFLFAAGVAFLAYIALH
jgi:NADH-quinone oxidoreductase subunit L